MYVSDYDIFLEQDKQVDETLREYISKLNIFSVNELLRNREEAQKNIYDYILLAEYPTLYDGERRITSSKFEDIKNIEAKINYILREKSLRKMTVDEYYNNK